MEERSIEFQAVGHGNYPGPVAAVKMLPEWLKRMTGEVTPPEGKEFLTVKRCPPFVEAVGFAYIIPVPFDVTFRMDAEGRLTAQSAGAGLTGWREEQYAGTPFAGSHVVNFPNPWVVKTPSGYSTMFVHPLNRYDFPFRVLTQVVETDTRTTPAAIPAVCEMGPGMSYTLERGMAMVQAIPIRRETRGHKVGMWDAEQQAEQEKRLKENPHMYKQDHWKKKGYL